MIGELVNSLLHDEDNRGSMMDHPSGVAMSLLRINWFLLSSVAVVVTVASPCHGAGSLPDDDVAQVIPQLSTLTELRASSHFNLEGLKQIGQLPSLKRLDLYHTDESDWTPEQAKLMFSSIRDVTVW